MTAAKHVYAMLKTRFQNEKAEPLDVRELKPLKQYGWLLEPDEYAYVKEMLQWCTSTASQEDAKPIEDVDAKVALVFQEGVRDSGARATARSADCVN